VNHLAEDIHLRHRFINFRADLLDILMQEGEYLGIRDQIEQLLRTKGVLLAQRDVWEGG